MTSKKLVTENIVKDWKISNKSNSSTKNTIIMKKKIIHKIQIIQIGKINNARKTATNSKAVYGVIPIITLYKKIVSVIEIITI